MSYQPSGESGQFPASYGGGLVEAEAPAPKPFLTPLKMLAIFLQINLLTYFDRGALASVLDKLKLPEQFDLSNTQAGILGGAYMAGYVVASPIFAHYAHTFRPMRMMAFGLTIWAIATAVTGLSPNYGVLVVARAFTGVGEASFLCLAPPFIDKFAPPSKRSLWLSIFFIGIPVGYAFGTIFADTWTGHAVFGANWTWRTVFLLEGIIMAPYIIFATFVKADFLQFETAHDPVQRKLTKSSFAEKQPLIREPSSDGLEVDSTTADLVEAMAHAAADLEVDPDVAAADKVKNQRLIDKVVYLVKNALYVLVVLAYSAQTFVTGGFAYWGVNFVQDSLNIKNNAGLLFGGITAAMGVVGTGFGGWVLDHYRSKAHLASKEPVVTPHGHIHREDPAKVNQSLEVAFRLILIFSIISWPAAAAAFLLSPKSPVYAFVGLAVAEFCLFSCISPINSAIMWTVPFEYNPIAVAMSVVGNHVLGDATSPTIIGAILDATGNNWVLSMNIGCCWLGFSIIFFFIGWRVAVRRVRQTPLVSDDAADGNEPLLHGGHPYSPITEPARV